MPINNENYYNNYSDFPPLCSRSQVSRSAVLLQRQARRFLVALSYCRDRLAKWVRRFLVALSYCRDRLAKCTVSSSE